jgi:quinoprotein dehydrogenase-associated probable ABC transporter substrate-binding protein
MPGVRLMIAVAALALAPLCVLAADKPAAATPALRVCADPNNLPFSNEAREGFENRLADMVAKSMGTHVEYTWWAQRRGFVRNTLNENRCDVVMGVPADYEMVLTTRPYYASGYVFVYRDPTADRLDSLDDPRLAHMRIAVPLLGESSAPPVLALARRGITRNVQGYSIFGDYREPNPPARLIDAVANGDADVAIAWGPLAGYFAARASRPLTVSPLPATDGPLPFRFEIAVGVRKGNKPLRDRIEHALDGMRPQIAALLAEYRVPVFGMASTQPGQP